MTVTLNGQPRDVTPGLSLEDLVTHLTSAPSGVAAAVNETVVPRRRWRAVTLVEGDRIEVLTAVQGG
ncbi:sulfur carrier protein ThiS [Streptomyces sp. NPDC005438]|uniref:sulfur carrier protein ThiS n=1 Tax=Streptomyces sp. NPDC005438 TaxID=3156880 RepID=UPI0033AC7EF7